jgi:hypothetical protein
MSPFAVARKVANHFFMALDVVKLDRFMRERPIHRIDQ